MIIYAASSWAATEHEAVAEACSGRGFSFLNYRDNNVVLGPAPGPSEFAKSPEARARYEADCAMIRGADAVVLILATGRAGRSSHIEAGYALGIGKPLIILADPDEPAVETGYCGAAAIARNIPEMLAALNALAAARGGP
jgi:nucleoside 2-deoxyribosyltransferase